MFIQHEGRTVLSRGKVRFLHAHDFGLKVSPCVLGAESNVEKDTTSMEYRTKGVELHFLDHSGERIDRVKTQKLSFGYGMGLERTTLLIRQLLPNHCCHYFPSTALPRPLFPDAACFLSKNL